MDQKTVKTLLIVIAVIVIGFLVYSSLNRPDERTAAERVSDAASSLSDGVTDAGRQLESRTLGERMGDAVEDVGDDIRRNGN